MRDYIHIVDLAQAHILALTSDVTGAFNLGTGTGYSVKEVIEAAREVTGHPIPAEESPRRPGDPPRLVASAAKANGSWAGTRERRARVPSLRAPGTGTGPIRTATKA